MRPSRSSSRNWASNCSSTSTAERKLAGAPVGQPPPRTGASASCARRLPAYAGDAPGNPAGRLEQMSARA
eukprot:11254326-Alexandrium_andersonii.AAC.1